MMDGQVLNQIEKKIMFCAERVDELIFSLRLFRKDEAAAKYIDFSMRLEEVITELVKNQQELGKLGLLPDVNLLMQYLQQLESAQKNRDNVLVADVLELCFRPFLTETMAKFTQVWQMATPGLLQKNLMALAEMNRPLCEQIVAYLQSDIQSARYVLEESNTGRKTLKVLDDEGEYYYYSNANPIQITREWANSLLDTNVQEYHVLGFGLGYVYAAIAVLTRNLYPIHCYETDMELLVIALEQMDITSYLKKGLVLHYDPDLKQLAPKVKDSKVQVILYPPAIRNVMNEQAKQSLMKYAMADSSMREQEIVLRGNFYQNQKLENIPNVDELAEQFVGKDVYIVAAGPSLDKNYLLLKQLSGEEGRHTGKNSLILATGTVFCKLLSAGIRPDYVIISEANEKVWGQVAGYAQETIPMLLLSTSTHILYERYQGQKYKIYQQEFDLAEQAAAKEGKCLYMTGGSVSTIACDVAIRLGAARVIFLGLDLAYTEGQAHSEGVGKREISVEAELVNVPAYNGGEVLADSKFMLYRDWFKRRLKMQDASGVEVIDATEGGALIPGMRCEALADVMSI